MIPETLRTELNGTNSKVALPSDIVATNLTGPALLKRLSTFSGFRSLVEMSKGSI